MTEDFPKPVFSNWLVAAAPGGFAGALHGFWIGIGVYVLVIALLAASFWTTVVAGWSWSTWRWMRTSVIVLAFVLVSLSGAEIGSVR